jgi:hypothetical protein
MFLCVANYFGLFYLKLILDRFFYIMLCLMIPMFKILIVFIIFIWVLDISVWKCFWLMPYLASTFKSPSMLLLGNHMKLWYLMFMLKMPRARCLDYLLSFFNSIMSDDEQMQFLYLRKWLNVISIVSH